MDWDIANAEEVVNWRVKQALKSLKVVQGEGVQEKDEGYLWLAIVANAIRKGVGHLTHTQFGTGLGGWNGPTNHCICVNGCSAEGVKKESQIFSCAQQCCQKQSRPHSPKTTAIFEAFTVTCQKICCCMIFQSTTTIKNKNKTKNVWGEI